jgi:hypothetical protein
MKKGEKVPKNGKEERSRSRTVGEMIEERSRRGEKKEERSRRNETK